MENKHWMNHRFWFFAFITTFLVILIFVIYVLMSITSNDTHLEKNQSHSKNDFTISFSNQQLEDLMNASLKKENITTEITTKHLSFKTKTKILNQTIDIKLITKPYKVNRDTIKFKIESIDIGRLNVSNPFVLSQIKSYTDLPSYIDLNHKDETIILKLNSLKIDNVESVQIKKLDISAKKWYFDIELQ